MQQLSGSNCLSPIASGCNCLHSTPAPLSTPLGSVQRRSLRDSRTRQGHRLRTEAVKHSQDYPTIWMPEQLLKSPTMRGAAPAAGATYDEHRARKPPPDLPSIMLEARIVFLGMPLVPAVTELLIAEMLYLQSRDPSSPVNLYINSTGTTRADGETVGFETEGTAVYDAMSFLSNPVRILFVGDYAAEAWLKDLSLLQCSAFAPLSHKLQALKASPSEIYTLGVGVAMGQSCMLLSAGQKGHRFMLPHATAMLQQPRLPPTGQRQAIEVHIKWREVLAQKQNLLTILNKTTGHSVEKLDADLQRPLYMQAQDAIEYGIVDRIVKPESELYGDVKKPAQWDKEAGLVERPAPGASQGFS